ncbi:MAG: hypothetical protein V8Q30_13425 [Acutalibacteraceae bacterium]
MVLWDLDGREDKAAGSILLFVGAWAWERLSDGAGEIIGTIADAGRKSYSSAAYSS